MVTQAVQGGGQVTDGNWLLLRRSSLCTRGVQEIQNYGEPQRRIEHLLNGIDKKDIFATLKRWLNLVELCWTLRLAESTSAKASKRRGKTR